MRIELNPNSDLQLYKQLSNQLIELIANGELKNGDTLPSVRALAADLGININTVSKSYHELGEKQLIELKPKAKAVVIGGQKKILSEQDKQQLETAFQPLLAEAQARGVGQEELLDVFKRMLNKWK